MLTLVRSHNSFGLDFIKDKLLSTPTRSSTDYYQHLAEIFKNRPNEIFMILSLDESDTVHGFIIAAQHRVQPYVWLYQAWADNQMTRELNKTALARLEIWTQEVLGLNEIRMETLRDAHRGFELYGFEQYSIIYSKNLGD